MKIAVNKQYGGFSLSMMGIKRYFELQGKEVFFYKQTEFHFVKGSRGDVYTKIKNLDTDDSMFHCVNKDLGDTTNDLPNENYVYLGSGDKIRVDPLLIQTVEELGKKASNQLSNIVIIEIPDDIEWEIEEYDGYESVHEKHRSW